MENEQIVGYVREQLALGHTEAVLREHLLVHGWQEGMLDDIFLHIHGASVSVPKASKRRHRHRASSQLRRRRRTLLVTGVVLIAAVLVWHFWPRHAPPSPAFVAQPISYQQKQNIDVNTVGGAVGQYALANGTLPTHLAVGDANNQLVMCNNICDPATSQISTLQVYGAPGVAIRPYAADLSVPDDKSMYLVPGASCTSRMGIGRPNSNPRSMVILYADKTDKGLRQHCVTL